MTARVLLKLDSIHRGDKLLVRHASSKARHPPELRAVVLRIKRKAKNPVLVRLSTPTKTWTEWCVLSDLVRPRERLSNEPSN
jgi:hypothetical protein